MQFLPKLYDINISEEYSKPLLAEIDSELGEIPGEVSVVI